MMIKVFCVFSMIVCFQCTGFSQSLNDSIDQLNALAIEKSETDILSAITYANISKQLNQDEHYEVGYTENQLGFGLIAYLTGDLEKALAHTGNAHKYNSEPKILAQILNQEGRILMDLNESVKANEKLRAALNINKGLRASKQIQGNYINLGNLKSRLFQIDSAFYFLNEALNIARKEKDTFGLVTIYNNMGALNGNLNELNLERTFYIKALELCNESSFQKSHIAYNISSSYLSDKQLNAAEKYAEIALKQSEKTNNLKGLKNAYALYGELEKQKKNYEKSLNYYLLYLENSEKLMNEEVLKKTTKLQLENEFENELKLDSIQKAKEIAIIQQEAIQQEVIHNEKLKRTTIILAFSIAILFLMGYILYRINKINIERKKANALISQQKKEVEEQKELIQEKQNDILSSITYAKRLQNAILPSDLDIAQILPDSFLIYLPKDIVAGDFYWVEKKADRIYFAVADCTGHGVPGAMVSVVCANALNSCINEYNLVRPGEILDKTTAIVLDAFRKGDEIIKDGMDISLCCYHSQTKELMFAGANNSLVITSLNDLTQSYPLEKFKTIQKDQFFLHEFKGDKQPVGYQNDRKEFTTISIKINKGDQIYMYSDGYPDQFGGAHNKKFKSKILKEFLLTQYDNEMSVQEQALQKVFIDWKGVNEQVDDVCLMGVKF